MKGWRRALYALLICLPALLVVGIGAALIVREIPGAIRYEPRRIGNVYREVAEGMATNSTDVVSGMRQKGWWQNGKVEGVPWGYVVQGTETVVWLSDGKGLCRMRKVATERPYPYALVFYGGGAVVAVVLLLLSAFMIWGFFRYLRARDDFLAATAHDLTTPLVGMRMMIGRNDDEAKRLNERMLLIVSNIKDFLKLGGKRRKPDLKPVDIVALAKEAYELFAADYADSEGGGVEFEVQGEGSRPTEEGDIHCSPSPSNFALTTLADETMTLQILWNLFGNDLKYAAPYGKVLVRFAAEDGFVRVEFVDEGQGMTSRQMKRAFDRYYRARTVLQSGKGGFGIGLCTAREFARAMGGDLTVRPNEPKGCVFALSLPTSSG